MALLTFSLLLPPPLLEGTPRAVSRLSWAKSLAPITSYCIAARFHFGPGTEWISIALQATSRVPGQRTRWPVRHKCTNGSGGQLCVHLIELIRCTATLPSSPSTSMVKLVVRSSLTCCFSRPALFFAGPLACRRPPLSRASVNVRVRELGVPSCSS